MNPSELVNWRAALRRMGFDRLPPGSSGDQGDAELAGGLASDDPLAQIAEVDAGDAPATVERRIEETVLRSPRRYTREQVHALTGIDDQRARQLWRSMGFPDVGQDDVVFTEGDLEAIGVLEQLRATGLVSTDLQDAVIRSIAQSMAGLATWQVELLYQVLRERQRDSAGRSIDLRGLLDALDHLQNYVWRRHLATATGRLLASAPSEADIRTLVVGSADLVGFTRTSRRLTPTQLIELVEAFHGIAARVVAEHGGRVVKTVGDAVLFVTDRPEDGAEIALDLVDQTVAGNLPELRVGLALGRTLTRFGDIYGEVVETASRLCTHARPGRVLVDHALATILDGDPRFRLRLRRPLTDPGYPRLHAWGLRRGRPPQE